MIVIKETKHYKLVVMKDPEELNYAIVNKSYNKIEARADPLFAAYDLLDELEEQLSKIVGKETATVRAIQ
jgi:hypothetical protein